MIDFMKRVINYLFSSMVLIALAGCQTKEMDMQINDSPDAGQKNVVWKEVVISASLEGSDVDTRTQRGVDKKTYWSPGDKIKIFSAGESSEFTSINTQPERVVKFKGLISFITGTSDENEDAKDYVWGLYPFSEDATYAEPDGISRTAEITTTLPSMQTAKAGTYDDGFAITIGRSETLSIPFYSAHSGFFVRFNRDDIISVTLRTVAGEPIAGRVTIGLDSNGKPVIKEHLTPSSQIVLYSEDGTPFETGKDYYIITLPLASAASGITFTVRTSGGLEGSYTMTSNKGFTRGSFRNLSDPLDVRIENPDNIANGISTGWVQSTTPALNEIWYTTTDDEAVTYIVPEGSTNVVDIDNSEVPSASNGHKGVIRFSAPITKIDEYALADCANIASITLPSSVEEILTGAFASCTNLTEVNLGTGLKHIYPYAFYETGISGITLPEGLESIDFYSFYHCVNLQQVRIPDSVKYLGFYNITFNGNPFAYCTALTSFSGKFASDDGKYLIDDRGHFVSSVISGMTGQTCNVPSGVRTIGSFAFAGSTLKAVRLPSDLVAIYPSAFFSSSIESITIPETVSRVYTKAFANCSLLSTVRMEGATPPTLADDVFTGTSSDMEIEIPGAGYMAYATGADNPWRAFHLQMVAYQTNMEIWYHNDISDVSANYDGDFGANYTTTITIPGDVLKGFKTIVAAPSSLGDQTDFRIMVFDGPVTSVGEYCFGDNGLYQEPALHVDFVSLPTTVTSIGNGAFKANTKLLKYPVPVGFLTSIGDDAFNGCTSMAGTNINWLSSNSVYTGYSNIELGARAFKGCVGFDKFAGQVTSMGKGAFQGCSSLTRASLGSLTEIPDSAFYGCQQLAAFTYDQICLTSIGDYAFRNCYALNLVYSGDPDDIIGVANINATIIGEYAFASCRGITAVNAPGLVTIDEYGFYGCSNMQSITAPSLENIKMYGLGNCYSLTSLELPAIKNLNNRALSYPRDLTLLRLGPNLRFIGDEVFYTINNQTVNGISVTINENQLDLYFEGTDLTNSKPNIQIKAFGYQYNSSGNTATYHIPFKFKKIYVPSSKLDDYKEKLKVLIMVDGDEGEYSYGDAGLVEGY